MTMTSKLLAGAAGLAAIAAAAPATAQYYAYPGYSNGYRAPSQYNYGYGYNGYNAYNNGYNAYNNGYAANPNMAAQQCSAAVQNRLYNRQNIGSILGALLGANTSGRVVSITQVMPRNNGLVRVNGLASSGRVAYNNYGPYGVGAYGALGYNQANAADLSFRCDVYPNGAVRNVDINRRY